MSEPDQEEFERQVHEALAPLIGEQILERKIRDAIRPVVKAIMERRMNDIEVIDTTSPEDEAQGRFTGTLRVRRGLEWFEDK